MMQCFKEPDVIFDNNPNDPQYRLFKKFLGNSSNIEILDYGAGKGRIGYTINEDKEVSRRIMYSAFEPDKINFKTLSSLPNLKNAFAQ